MIYHSTRDTQLQVSSAQAIVKGIAPDGGLFVPSEKPKISIEDIVGLVDKSYREKAKGILGLFLSDFSAEEISDCVEKAYNKTKFETDSIAPLYELNDSTYILELWHGPTCAFKDMALQILPHLMTTSMRKIGIDKQVAILVATSGDTGKAALEGFKDVEGTKIQVFFPTGGVSEMQKKQMVTQEGNNVGVTSVNGNFDDAQSGVKQIFGDKEFNDALEQRGYLLSSANSINWGRLVPQIIYYVSAYCDLVKADKIKAGDAVNVCVPTGNFGNILAAWYAKEMGIPIRKFICASNENNVFTDFNRTGIYDKNREFKATISPSMDILISSNLERLLFDITGEDEGRVREWMQDLQQTGRYEVPQVTKDKLKEYFFGGFCDDTGTKQAIADVWREYSYLMDTHTAVGYQVYRQYVEETGDTTKTIVASTANPFKFCSSVLEAVQGQKEAGLDEFEVGKKLSEVTGQKIPAGLAQLKEKDERFSMVCDKEAMKQIVDQFLG